MSELTQARLKELLHYCPETGRFTWLKPRGVAKGSSPGAMNGNGYIQIKIDYRRYMAHRLAWLYIYGEFPSDMLDHINRIKTDNRLENLRLATNSENQQNAGLSKGNTSGAKGVSWHKVSGCWRVQIRAGGKKKHIGSFKDFELAELVASEARELYCGEFCRHK